MVLLVLCGWTIVTMQYRDTYPKGSQTFDMLPKKRLTQICDSLIGFGENMLCKDSVISCMTPCQKRGQKSICSGGEFWDDGRHMYAQIYNSIQAGRRIICQIVVAKTIYYLKIIKLIAVSVLNAMPGCDAWMRVSTYDCSMLPGAYICNLDPEKLHYRYLRLK